MVLCGGGEGELSKGLSILKKGGTLVNLSAYFGGKPLEIDPAVWGFGYGDKTIKGVGCGGGRLWLVGRGEGAGGGGTGREGSCPAFFLARQNGEKGAFHFSKFRV